jgi:SAM-dependent methyltransferase
MMPPGPGNALDFGCGTNSYLGLMAAQRGFNVTSVDLELVEWSYVEGNLMFVQGDILKLSLPKEHFDLVINCSTVEHVGLVGRYGVTESQPNGDLEAMTRLREIIKPSGVMLLTIPIGQDAIFAPLHRVYGKERLPQLLQGYRVEKEIFWTKNSQNLWVMCDRESALNFKAFSGSWDPLQNAYALGCYVLRRE